MNVGFPDKALDFAFRVTAAVIAAIADDQQRLLAVLGLFHLVHSQVNGIQQRSAAFGNGIDELALDVFHRAGEVREQFRTIGEGN